MTEDVLSVIMPPGFIVTRCFILFVTRKFQQRLYRLISLRESCGRERERREPSCPLACSGNLSTEERLNSSKQFEDFVYRARTNGGRREKGRGFKCRATVFLDDLLDRFRKIRIFDYIKELN